MLTKRVATSILYIMKRVAPGADRESLNPPITESGTRLRRKSSLNAKLLSLIKVTYVIIIKMKF